jgi:hypothetical protein
VHHKLEDQGTFDLGFSLGYTSALETITTHIDFLRRHDVDEFLDTLSYHELLGFLPMFVDYYVQIPQFFLRSPIRHDKGDTRTGRITDAAPKISCTDWERNMPVNHIATATAIWVSTKLQYSEEDLEWTRSWPA